MNSRLNQKPTRTDFNLNQLINIYIQEYSGVILSRKHREYLPVFQVYADVMEMLYRKNDEGVEVFKSVREKIIGKEYLKSAPSEYWDVLTALDLGYELDDWFALSIETKAKITAARYVKNMIDVIERYYDEMDERLKKLNDKN